MRDARAGFDRDFIGHAVAERGANARDQLVEVERLGQVIERADALRERGRFDRAARGHQDHARRIAAFGDRLQQRQAGLAGHVDVAEDDVDAMRAQRLQRRGDVAGLHGFRGPTFSQRHGRALADAGIVVDDEHASASHRSRFRGRGVERQRDAKARAALRSIRRSRCRRAISRFRRRATVRARGRSCRRRWCRGRSAAKIFSRSVSLMPGPRSSTSRMASLSAPLPRAR